MALASTPPNHEKKEAGSKEPASYQNPTARWQVKNRKPLPAIAPSIARFQRISDLGAKNSNTFITDTNVDNQSK